MKLALCTLLALSISGIAHAQCAQWSPGFARPSTPLSQRGVSFGTDSDANALGGAQGIASFDAGGGARLYTLRQSFFVTASVEVVRWDGVRWESVFTFPGAAHIPDMRGPLVSLHTGAPSLVVSQGRGPPATVWNFDGTTWTPLPPIAGWVTCLESFDIGAGPTLFAGAFTLSPARFWISAWNGTSWTQLGPDLSSIPHSLALHDDGGGTRLYAATNLATPPASAITRWDGAAWQPVGAISNSNALCSYQGGLYAGVPSGLLRLVAGAWTAIPSVSGTVYSLGTYDHGSGPRLAIAASELLSYDTATFTTIGTARHGGTPRVSFASVARAGGATHYVSAPYDVLGGVACLGFASTDGTMWSTLGRGFDTQVSGLARHVTANGEELLAAGSLSFAGFTGPVSRAVRWSGTDWVSLPGTPPSSTALAIHSVDLGSGSEIYVTSSTPPVPTFAVQRWNGASWSTLPSLGTPTSALGDYLQAGVRHLVAGGPGSASPTGSSVHRLVGNTWQRLANGTAGTVYAFANYDEGSGENLFAGGAFSAASGVFTGAVARWNGSAWSALGTGPTGEVRALAVFDDGNGAQLYAAGLLSQAGGVPVTNLARWNGSVWSDVPGGGPNGTAYALAVHDDGRGPALYVGGSFNTCGGITAYSLARFDGANWEAVDGGIDGFVYALASIDDDGDGDRELFVGGRFQQTATVASSCIARLEGCPHYASFCAGDGQYLDHTTPCPCGNDGAAGHGCASSFVADGALLEASGSTANDTLVLHVTGTPQSSLGIYLQHDAQDDRVFHDGVLCASGNLIRLRRHFSVGGESMFPDSTDTTTIAQRGSVTPGSGATRFYSCFYRNASTTFCPPATANVSNGIRVIW
jgi:hypothetical protein